MRTNIYNGLRKCLNYKKIDSEYVQCLNCSHFCRIRNGNVGICGIRKNIDGTLCLLSYGKAIALHVDSIEKIPFFHFLPGSFAYSFGTLGCNFQCDNCQNYDISQMFGYKGKTVDYRKFDWGNEVLPTEIVKEAIKNNCKSIAYTYNEPTIFLEYALDTMKIAKKKGIKNVWVSNGYMSRETLDLILPWLDAINVGIKSFDDDFYRLNCGALVNPVLENCKYLSKKKVWLEITTLVIPCLTDDIKMLNETARFIKKYLGDFVPWHVSAFSSDVSWKLQYLKNTPDETKRKAHEIGSKEGLKYVYAGNVRDSELESTKCSNCGKFFIKRVSCEMKACARSGKCLYCGKRIEGVFK